MTNFTPAQIEEIETISRGRAKRYVVRSAIGFTLMVVGLGFGLRAGETGSLHNYEHKAAITRVHTTKERCTLIDTLTSALERPEVKARLKGLSTSCAIRLQQFEAQK